MNLSIKGLFLGLGALITVLLVSGLLAYQNTRQLREDAAWVTRSHQVLEALQNTLGAMTDAETGQRGYLLTADPLYLEPYQAGLAQAGGLLRELRDLVRDNPRQRPRVALLEGLVEAKEKELAETVAMQSRDPEAARRMVQTHLGRSIMVSIRAQVAAMSQEERTLLAERERTSRRGYRTAILSGTLFALLGLAAVVIFGFQLREHLGQRDRLERALEKQRQWLQVTLGSIGDAVIATGRDGAVTFLNPVAEQLTGWTPDAAAGQPLPTVFRILNEQTRETAPDPAARVLREGVVVGLANHTALVARDGRELPIEDSAAPIRDGAGEVAGAVLVFRDATGKRAAEKELRQREQRFRTLMELSPDAIWVNRDDRIELVNSQALRLLGASSADQVEGRSPWEIFHPDCHDLVRRRLTAVRGGQPFQLSEETVVRLDGALRQVEVACAPFTDARGPAIQVVLRDITRRRQRDQELERLNRALRALTKSNQALMRSESIPEPGPWRR
jgi:PAS domain S-box-containing protein